MNGTWLIPLTLMAADAGRYSALPSPMVIVEACRQDVRKAMATSHGAKKPDPERVVPELLALYVRLDSSVGFPAAERQRLLRLVGMRLHELELTLDKRVNPKPAATVARTRLTTTRRRPSSTVLTQRLPNLATGASQPRTSRGGLSNAGRAQELIDLIRSTVDPETWDVQGGEGSIFYFDPVLGLVVRQTAEVHEHVAETLRGVR